MSMQDPISDLLTRIRNAQMVGKKTVCLSTSKMKQAILTVLKEEGYILNFDVSEGIKSVITVYLKYYQGKPVIEKLKRVSRPGLRTYQASKTLPRVLGGFGIAIISTSKGVMTNLKARSAGVGGEVLCTVE
jgi:small subunit ribosomal protein S8